MAHVALFDATSLTAKGVKEQLAARSFPLASMRLYTSRTDPEASLTEFAGEAMLVTAPDIDALGRLDIAFLCGTREEGALYLDWAARKGFVAIDLTTASSAAGPVPLVNVNVNPQSIPGNPGLVATPRPIAQFLSTLLDPIQRSCGLEAVHVVVFQPASELGEEGIEELYQQTLGLLNFQETPRRVFGRQVAFNLIPVGHDGPGGAAGGAGPPALEQEVMKITGGAYRLSVEVVLAPVFHCHAAMAHVRLPTGKRREDLLAALRESREVSLAPAEESLTPVGQAGKSGVRVATIRTSPRDTEFWIWAVTDNLQSGTALNAVRIAEALVDRGFARGRG
jgi:aspartate-semialdehyde dehydrogenase